MGIRGTSDPAVVGVMISHSHCRLIPAAGGKVGAATTTAFPHNLLPSAPASPPTPAPSPTPQQVLSCWQPPDEQDEEEEIEDVPQLDHVRYFEALPGPQKQQYLETILSLCNTRELSFVLNFVSPRLKIDPFAVFPTEISLRVSLLTDVRF